MRLADVDLHDPDSFVDRVPHEMFAVLRREAPVHFHPEPGGPGFWVLSRYADVKQVSKTPQLFSSQRQGTLILDPSAGDLPFLQAIMLNMDPPKHRVYRNLVNKVFTPRMVQCLLPKVRAMATHILDRVGRKGECDFVTDVAGPLPMQVICEMMGVPEEDRDHIYEISNRMIGSDDPEFEPIGENDYRKASAEMFLYAAKIAENSRRQPGDDIATALLQAEVDGQKLSDLDFNSFFLLLAIAGNETTRTVTTNGMLALIEHPDQRRKLLANPRLLPSAVEEMLRFNPPVHYFRRTATKDTEIRGVRIREGDKVTLWYPSANRDEEVFSDPDRFDVERSPNDHLAFGVGEHFCLGANLARMELQVIFAEIQKRLPDLELAAPPRRLRSNFINGVKEMRVRFTPERD